MTPLAEATSIRFADHCGSTTYLQKRGGLWRADITADYGLEDDYIQDNGTYEIC